MLMNRSPGIFRCKLNALRTHRRPFILSPPMYSGTRPLTTKSSPPTEVRRRRGRKTEVVDAEPYSQARAQVVEYIPFKNMSFEQKVVHTGVSLWTIGLGAVALVVFGQVGKALYGALFSTSSKEGIVNISFEKLKNNALVIEALGNDIFVMGQRRGQYSMHERSEKGKNYRTVEYVIQSGKGRRAAVYVEMVEKESDLWDYNYLIIQIPNEVPIHIVDRRMPTH
eukprot:260119_1